jgi:hypothetical protein
MGLTAVHALSIIQVSPLLPFAEIIMALVLPLSNAEVKNA